MYARETWGVPGPVDSVMALVERECERTPDLPALEFDDGKAVTRRELLEGARSFASYLCLRVKRGDFVAIMLGNRAEYFMAWLGAISNRCALVSINPAFREHDTGHILRDSGAKIVITSADHLELLERLKPTCPALETILCVGDNEPHGLSKYVGTNPRRGRWSQITADDVVSVYYTSGTTGTPKGCLLNHNFWLRFVEVYMSLYGIRPSDRLLCWFQFSYVDPPWMLLASLKAGTTLVVMRRFSVSRFWHTVVCHGVTILYGSASVPLLLLASPLTAEEMLHHVRYCVHIGIPAEIHGALRDRWGFPWYEAYGLTETGLVISMPPDSGNQMIGTGSIGLPCEGVQIRVADGQDNDVESGKVGELLLQAPGLTTGYLGRPVETIEAFRGGWFHTGDLARVDIQGFVYFMGRAKDVIRRSGENIAAAEVETVLRSHPKVVDAAVIPVSDCLRGEEAKAYVLVRTEETVVSLPPSELAAHCEAQLAAFKVPRYWVYRTGDFPRTSSMRVRKEELKSESALSGVIWDREGAGRAERLTGVGDG